MEQVILKGGTSLIDVPEFLKRLGAGSGQTVADLGCGGGGHFVAPTAMIVGTSGIVYAVDIQKKVLQSLEASLKLQNIGNVKIVWSDLEKVGAADIPNESCDFVIVANVLFQNKDHESIVKEAARMTKKGGILAIIDWKKTVSPFGPPLEFRVNSDDLKTIGEGIGLHPFDVFDVGAYHFAILFKKKSD